MPETLFINLGSVFLALPLLLAVVCVIVWSRWPQSVKTQVFFGRAGIVVSLILLIMSGWMAWALNADKGSALSSSIRSPAGWTHAFVFWEDVITINVHIDAISLYFILLANIVALAASLRMFTKAATVFMKAATAEQSCKALRLRLPGTPPRGAVYPAGV